MEWKRRFAPRLALAVLVVVAIAAPPVFAQMVPSSNTPTGVSVQKTTTIDAQGNTVVTERTFINGRLAKQEITVTSPAGRPVSKTETVFNAAGQVVKREIVAVSAGTVTKTEQKFANGQLVREEITTTTLNNGQRVKVEREFQVVNGVLKEVKEQRKIEKVERADQDNRGRTGVSGANRGRDNEKVEAAENEHQSGAGSNGGGGDRGGGGRGGDSRGR